MKHLLILHNGCFKYSLFSSVLGICASASLALELQDKKVYSHKNLFCKCITISQPTQTNSISFLKWYRPVCVV